MADREFQHIVRVANTDLDGNKKAVDALRKIKGVSYSFANAVCQTAGVDRGKQAGQLSEAQVKKLQSVLDDPVDAGIPEWMANREKDYETGEDKHLLTNDLIFVQDNDVKRLKKIKSYRGSRHAKDLPVRGQRTKSNFRPNKGKKR